MRVTLNPADIQVIVSVENTELLELIRQKLGAAGFRLREISYGEVFPLEPHFGQHKEAVFVVNMGDDRERMHTLAQHLYATWSEEGFVLYIVFYPTPPQDAEMFQMWKLDAGWRLESPQMFWTLSRPSGEGLERDVDELIYVIPRMISYQTDEEK